MGKELANTCLLEWLAFLNETFDSKNIPILFSENISIQQRNGKKIIKIQF